MSKRKLWIADGGTLAITSTKQGESNAERWGWTPAKAVPESNLEAVYDLHGLFERNGDKFCRHCSEEVAAKAYEWLEHYPCMTLQYLEKGKK